MGRTSSAQQCERERGQRYSFHHFSVQMNDWLLRKGQ
jgi:hypothetical protein